MNKDEARAWLVLFAGVLTGCGLVVAAVFTWGAVVKSGNDGEIAAATVRIAVAAERAYPPGSRVECFDVGDITECRFTKKEMKNFRIYPSMRLPR